MRQTMFLDAGPLRSAIVGNINAAAGTSAEFAIRMHLRLPHPGEQRVRIVRVHRKPGAPYILAGEENSIPVRTAIAGSVNPALLLRTGHAAQDAGENDIRIVGVNHDSADSSAVLETHVGPGLAGIDRL